MLDKKKITAVILKRALIFLAIVILTSVSLDVLSRKSAKIAASISEKKKAEAVLQKRNAVAAILRIDLNKIAPYEQKIKDMIPPADNILKFMAALENLAKTHRLQQTLTFGTPSTPAQHGTILFSSVNYTLAITASEEQFFQYLKDFENLPYLTSISSVNIVAPGDWRSAGGATIKAVLYTQTAE